MSFPESIDFEMRRGKNSHPQMEVVERFIAEQAFKNITTNSNWSELSFRTAYNFLYLNTFYGTQNPELIRLVQQVEPYPRMIEMEVVQGYCPLNCIMCERTYWGEPPQHVSLKDFKYVMDMFPDLGWAGNNGLGDPFTNKDYPEMVKYLDDKEVCQEIYMTSFLLQEVDMKKFADYNSFMLTKFSFDAATKETYEKIRVNGDYDKAVKNIKALDRYKKQRGKHFPQIEFHYLLLKQNLHEAEMFLDFVDGLGIEVSGVMYSKLLHNFGKLEGIYTEVPDGLMERLVQKGQSLGIPVYFNGDASQCKPKTQTCTQTAMPYIFQTAR